MVAGGVQVNWLNTSQHIVGVNDSALQSKQCKWGYGYGITEQKPLVWQAPCGSIL
jgi:hypothetical protein